MSFPFDENGLGFRRLVDIEQSFACKLWWKWRTGDGLWASYVNQISIACSCVYSRIKQVDDIMVQNTFFRIRNGSSFFLIDNWSGCGSLLQLFHLQDCDAFLSLRVQDLIIDGV